MRDRQSGAIKDFTEKFDRSVHSFAWFQNGDRPTIFAAVEEHGEAPIFVLAQGQEEPFLFEKGHNDDLVMGGAYLYFTAMSADRPNEILRRHFAAVEKSSDEGVTEINAALLSQIDMQPLESFTFKGASNDDVQGFMIKPPGFDPAKKYPLKFLIHGGPPGIAIIQRNL